MSLVAYGSSDESDEDDNQNESVVISKKCGPVASVNKGSVEVKISRNECSPSKSNGNYGKEVVNGFTSETETPRVAADISDDEDEIGAQKLKSNDIYDCPPTENKSLLSLPAPKSKLHDIDFDWSRLTKGSKGSVVQPVKISIPSLAELESEESAEPVKKKLKPSKKGSGLFALLPSPKNTFFNPTKTSLKPQQIQKKPQPKPSVKSVVNASKNNQRLSSKLPPVNYEDSDDEDEENADDKKVDFFSLSSPVEVPAVDLPEVPDLESIGVVNKKEDLVQLVKRDVNKEWSEKSSESKSVFESTSIDTTPLTNDIVSSPATSSASYIPLDQEDLQLDEAALQQLCGRRERQKGGSGFQVIDINGDAILPDAREWLTKQLTEEQNTNVQSHKKKDGPTTQQRRKHQITYLAFQAKEHELELKNQWANNRMSRKQTQAKYGF